MPSHGYYCDYSFSSPVKEQRPHIMSKPEIVVRVALTIGGLLGYHDIRGDVKKEAKLSAA